MDEVKREGLVRGNRSMDSDCQIWEPGYEKRAKANQWYKSAGVSNMFHGFLVI